MGNSVCRSKKKINAASAIPYLSADEISTLLSQPQVLKKNQRLSLRCSYVKIPPLSKHFKEAVAHGHWECVVLLHQRYSAHIDSTDIDECLKLAQVLLEEDLSDTPKKQVRKRQKLKTVRYLQHCKHVQSFPDTEELEDEVSELLLIAAWRFANDVWMEELLEDMEMDSPAVFALLKEALHDGDQLFVSDLISRGATLEIEVPKRNKGGSDGVLCWDTALHHCATSLMLKSNGLISPLVRTIMGTGRGFVDRRDQDEHTPLSLAVQEGNLSMVRILINEYSVDLDFEMQNGVPFRVWATDSTARSGVSTVESIETEEISLVMKALFSMREDSTVLTSSTKEQENIAPQQKQEQYVFDSLKDAKEASP